MSKYYTVLASISPKDDFLVGIKEKTHYIGSLEKALLFEKITDIPEYCRNWQVVIVRDGSFFSKKRKVIRWKVDKSKHL